VSTEEGYRTATDGGVNTTECVTEKDIERLRYHIFIGVKKGTEAELCLVCHRLHLIENYELAFNTRPSCTDEIEDPLADDLNGTLIAGVQIERAQNG